MKPKLVEKLAAKYSEKLKLKFKDPRYTRVIGKFVAAGLLEHNKVPAYRGPVTLDEVLWVGEVEPRVLELLPAVILRRPKIIRVQRAMPEDLKEVVLALRKNEAMQDFRGIPAIQYSQWLERVGRKSTTPSILKSFRFQLADIEVLKSLKKKTGLTETEIIRRAIQKFV